MFLAPDGIGRHTEVEMIEAQGNRAIELEAARLAIEWKNIFAAELQIAAQRLAKDSELVTTEHLLQALPIAAAKVLWVVESQHGEPANGQRQIA